MIPRAGKLAELEYVTFDMTEPSRAAYLLIIQREEMWS